MTELLDPSDKTTDEELLLMNKEKWSLEMESTLDEDAMTLLK